MIEQVRNVEVNKVNTMFGELHLKAFFVNTFSSAHDPKGFPNIPVKEYMIRSGER